MPFNVFNQNDSTGAITVEEFNTGWRNDKKAFYIEDDALAVLKNATADHGEIKKRQNNKLIGITSIQRSASFNVTPTSNLNLAFNIFSNTADIPANEAQKMSPYEISLTVNGNPYTVVGENIFNGAENVGVINFSNGSCAIDWDTTADVLIEITYSYYTLNPVLGIGVSRNKDRYTLFDRKYAYDYLITQDSLLINRSSDYASSDNLCLWTGTDNDRFYSTNYQNAQFVTNGISGRHFINITNISQDTNAVITLNSHNLKANDVVFINEVSGMTEINLKTAIITAVTDTTITTDVDSSAFTAYTSGGVIQTLTQSQSGSGIKYKNEDGFVNFAPPISSNRYLLGCNFLIVFNGILICFGTYEGTASGNEEYFPLRMRYSAVGNAFYAFEDNVFENSWMDALVGSGGFIDFDSTGEEITYAKILDGFLIVGFRYGFVRASYTFNVEDIFLTYYFPSHLGSESNASAVHMDKYVLSFSERGIIATSHDNIQRIDDKIFYASQDLNIQTSSKKHVHSIRDTEKEYVYISYRSDDANINFNNRTIVFNYENNSFALFDERSTAQTNFFDFDFFTFNKLGKIYRTFNDVPGAFIDYFNETRTASTAFATSQGMFIQRTESAEPEESIIVRSVTVNTDFVSELDAPNHSLEQNDYILMKKNGNNTIFKVTATTNDTATTDSLIEDFDGTETFHLLYNIDITTKQFAPFWSIVHRMDVVEKYFLVTANKNFSFNVDAFNIQSSQAVFTDNFTVEDRDDADSIYTEWLYSTQSTLSSSIQLKIYFSDANMRNINNHISNFFLNKLYIITKPSGHLTSGG